MALWQSLGGVAGAGECAVAAARRFLEAGARRAMGHPGPQGDAAARALALEAAVRKVDRKFYFQITLMLILAIRKDVRCLLELELSSLSGNF